MDQGRQYSRLLIGHSNCIFALHPALLYSPSNGPIELNMSTSLKFGGGGEGIYEVEDTPSVSGREGRGGGAGERRDAGRVSRGRSGRGSLRGEGPGRRGRDGGGGVAVGGVLE